MSKLRATLIKLVGYSLIIFPFAIMFLVLSHFVPGYMKMVGIAFAMVIPTLLLFFFGFYLIGHEDE